MVPRMLLTTKVANASPSISSAMTNNGRPDFAALLQNRQNIANRRNLLVMNEKQRIFQLRHLPFRLIDEYGEV